jgi:hypothetical protein
MKKRSEIRWDDLDDYYKLKAYLFSLLQNNMQNKKTQECITNKNKKRKIKYQKI